MPQRGEQGPADADRDQASGTTRCALVATTAAALGFTGSFTGIAGGYVAAIGFSPAATA